MELSIEKLENIEAPLPMEELAEGFLVGLLMAALFAFT